MFLRALLQPASLNISLPPFLLFMSPRFHSGHMFWRRQSYSHTHTQTHSYSWACVLIVSICCLWCCAAALLLTNWPFHHGPNDKTEAVTPPSTKLPPNQLHTLYTRTHIYTMAPSVTMLLLLRSSYGPCVTLGPLCLIRCYNQTTKGLWHGDLLSILHMLPEQDSSFCVCVCVCRRMLCREQRGTTINENNKTSYLFSQTCKLCETLLTIVGKLKSSLYIPTRQAHKRQPISVLHQERPGNSRGSYRRGGELGRAADCRRAW